MKIKEQLANTLLLVATHKDTYLPLKKTTSYIFELERRLTWFELKELFKSGELEATPQNLEIFVNFLQRRWQRILAIPQLLYTHTYADELTLVCETLAHELQMLHRLQLLMPGVNFYNENIGLNIVELDKQIEDDYIKQSYIAAGADIGLLIREDHIKAAVAKKLTPEQIKLAEQRGIELAKPEKINLHHFVTDDKKMIIHIGDCLVDAQYDGRLKHTNKLPLRKNSKLALKELNRVIYSSKEAKVLHDAVVEFWKTRKKSNSVGGHLNRLIEGLYKAGEDGGLGGTDEQPADLIFVYIEKFHFLTKLLKPAELEELLSIDSVLGDNFSFRYYWYRLLQGYPALLTNKELETINAFIVRCKEIEVEVEENRVIAEIAAEVRQRVTVVVDYTSASCDTPCIQEFARELNSMLNRHFELYYMVPESYIENEERDLKQVKENFEILRDQFRKAVAENKLTHFSVSELNVIFSTHNQLFNATNPIPAIGSESVLIKKLCVDMVATPASLIEVFAIVPEKCHKWVLTEYLATALKNVVQDNESLTLVLMGLNQKAQMLLLRAIRDIHSNKFLRGIYNSFDSLYKLLQVPEKVQWYILENMGKKHLRSLINDDEYLKKLKIILVGHVYQKMVDTILSASHVAYLKTISRAGSAQPVMPPVITQPSTSSMVFNGLIQPVINLGLFAHSRIKRTFSFSAQDIVGNTESPASSVCPSSNTKRLRVEEEKKAEDTMDVDDEVVLEPAFPRMLR